MNENLNERYKAEEQNKPQPPAIGGIFFIAMGGIALLAASGVTIAGRSPWMLFGLLPAIWIVWTAYQRYEANGRRLTRGVLAILIWCLIPLAFVVAGFAGLQTSVIWPLAIILTGLCLLIIRPGK